MLKFNKLLLVQALPIFPVKIFFYSHQTGMVHLSGLRQNQKDLVDIQVVTMSLGKWDIQYGSFKG